MDPGFIINPDIAGTKMFIVTGLLSLYGQAPSTVWTKLTAIAKPGNTTISVSSTSGWNVGDQIAIAPSFNNASEHEVVTITSINSGTSVSFTPALKYTHYGAGSATISNSIGTLDTRAGVAHLTRNIKFVTGADSGWGYQVIVNGFLDQNDNLLTGSAILSGV